MRPDPRDSAARAGRSVTVTVPATSANLGPGFDSLGLAVELRDELVATVVGPDRPELTLEVTGEGAGEVPLDATHLVIRALDLACARWGLLRPPLLLRCTNRIPHGRGLGSSAAAAVAGVLLARALGVAGEQPGEDEVLALATEIEGHPDNAAACLLGGLTIAWQEGGGVRAVRSEVSPEVRLLVLVPATSLSTQRARGMLPATVAHADAAFTAGRAALLVEALTRQPALLLAATEDRLHQAYRAAAMPGTTALLRALRDAGVPAVVSGAGPSLLVLTGADAAGVAAMLPDGWRQVAAPVATTGATVRREG